MTEGRFKSRTFARIKKKLPGTETVTHYRKKKPSKAQCGKCGVVLAGVPKELSSKMKRMPKSKKRPERPFGGVLCTKCSRELIKEKARE